VVAGGRITSLDGLRGVAAVLVVAGHARLVIAQTQSAPTGPLRPLSDLLGAWGGHAVWLFFVLSGLVLSRMLIQRSDLDYGRYVLARVARLYIPVIGAVVFAFVMILLFPRNGTDIGPWVQSHPRVYEPWAVLSDMTLISGTTSNLSPLWSLRWEVLFSLLLVLYVTAARRIPWYVTVGLSIVAATIGDVIDSSLLFYMAMFAIGTGLAYGWDRISRFTLRGWVSGAAATVLVLVCVAAQGIGQLTPHLPIGTRTATALGTVVSLAALTALIVIIPMTPVAHAFNSRPIQWLGTISFSLYLVHEPVLLAFVYTSRADPMWVWIGAAVSLPVAYLFYLLVERHAHRLAKRISTRRSERNPGPLESSSTH
jgi:peptidoglycan/LPS O-acetylase OafA/YrhL